MRSGCTSPITAMPNFGSGSSTVWPPATRHPASRQIAAAPAEHFAQQVERQRFARPRRDVEREQRGAAHRVHVAQRVRGGDCAPGRGVVDDRGEEVDRGHQCPIGREAIDGSVVPGRGVDQQRGVGNLRAHDEGPAPARPDRACRHIRRHGERLVRRMVFTARRSPAPTSPRRECHRPPPTQDRDPCRPRPQVHSGWPRWTPSRSRTGSSKEQSEQDEEQDPSAAARTVAAEPERPRRSVKRTPSTEGAQRGRVRG